MNQSLVPTLELCQKMKELGWKKDTMFYHHVHEHPQVPSSDLAGIFTEWEDCKWDVAFCDKYPAPTLQEILEELPEYVGEDMFLEMYKDSSNSKDEEWYLVRYVNNDGIGHCKTVVGFNELSPINACAKMWIYLKENGLLEEEKI